MLTTVKWEAYHQKLAKATTIVKRGQSLKSSA
jgi:hypothetical protein